MSFFQKIFGDPNDKIIKNLQPVIKEINSFEEKISSWSDEQLKQRTIEFKEGYQVALGKNSEEASGYLDEILPEAFAMMREASKRTVGMRHFDVQMVGGVILHRGQIAEMKTGEGKTLVATLPLYLNALTGKGVHLVTVNDYLAKVGAGWMGQVYDRLGLTTAVIIHEQALKFDSEYNDENQYDERIRHFRPVTRKEAYACDVLYGTNNEFGFDYLKDNMVSSLEQMVQRPLNYAIVDEVDSILIDEARTPLIISSAGENATDKYYNFAELVSRLDETTDYNVDEKMRAATLTEAGISKMEKWLGVENIYVEAGVGEVMHIEQALKARVLFKKDKDYVVKDGEVIIVDEFTGRLMYGRRYSEGLHQAIEAKEGVEIQKESRTLATVTFQNYFRMYEKLAGMTGTALTEAEEFSKIYELETVVIPTNKPTIRHDSNDLIYATEAGKFQAVANDIKERHLKGQPVLVGTISIEKSEVLADLLARQGVEAEVLNAKYHEKEAQIISQAGRRGAVTIATNMAGRGVDIILGGNPPEGNEQEEVRQLGGLHVIGTERHEARRIDNQLRGRAGRQGDPGSSQFYISTDDDLMRIFGGDRLKKMMSTLKLPEDMPIENSLVSKSIESAQKRVEGNNFDLRKHLVEYDDVINKHRESIYRRRRQLLELGEDLDNNQNKVEEPLTKLSGLVLEIINNEIESIVSFHTQSENSDEWNIAEISQVMSTIIEIKPEELVVELNSLGEKSEAKLDKINFRDAIVNHLIEMVGNAYRELLTIAKDLGLDWLAIEKSVMLRSIDAQWIDHLEAMDYMRKGIGLRGYGQRDPLVEYKKEAYRLFNELNAVIQKQIVYSIFKIVDFSRTNQQAIGQMISQADQPKKVVLSSNGETEAAPILSKQKDQEGHKVGRNDLCPCGSGKKYKKCCGK
ncbi:MAG TPA: preprotein translocase subunit SecA [bacterium]|nr:preprotein translocase subunit SecA [bacterium]